MNAKVHPLVAVLVIVATLAALGVWAWGSGAAKEIGGPAGLIASPSGHLYVQMQNVLLEHDTEGQFVKRHDLSRLGVERVLGAIGFFPDGDVLLRRGPDERTLLDNVRAYLRLQNENPTVSMSPESGLYRCNLESGECRQFGSSGVDFNAAFSLYIDPADSTVYISDTTRHALRKYSGDGEHLGDAEDGLKFPNELVMHDGRLYVANTNHHEIRIVSPETDSFGREIVSVDVIPEAASLSRQIWPSHLVRVGDEWWVNNMRSGMNEGGIYIFDDDWNFKARVDLPPGADPIALLPFNGEVLVSDWNNDRIHRVLVNGIRLGDFESPGLHDLVAESVERRWQYQAIAWFALAVLALLILGLLVKGLLTDATKDASEEKPKTQVEFPDEMVWFTPDERVARQLRLSAWLGGVLVVALIPLLIYVMVLTDFRLATYELALPVVVILVIFVPIVWSSHRNTKSAIGIQGDTVTLRNHVGNEVAIPMARVSYSKSAIAGPDSAVFLGQHQLALYDREVLETQVFPRLTGAKSISAWDMQMTLIRMGHPQGVAAVVVIVGAFLAGIAYALLR